MGCARSYRTRIGGRPAIKAETDIPPAARVAWRRVRGAVDAPEGRGTPAANRGLARDIYWNDRRMHVELRIGSTMNTASLLIHAGFATGAALALAVGLALA